MVVKAEEMRIESLVFISLLVLLVSCNMELTERTREVVDRINEEDALVFDDIGFLHDKPKRDFSLMLDSVASDRELVFLADRGGASLIRYFSFVSLLKRNSRLCKGVLVHHLRDKDNITVRICVHEEYSEPLLDRMIKIYQNRLDKSEEEKKDSMYIDSLLLCTPSVPCISYYEKLFKTMPLKDNWYKTVKAKYQQDQNAFALLALARYKRNEDKVLIVSALRNYYKVSPATRWIAIDAVQLWPDKTYFKLLADIVKIAKEDFVTEGMIEALVAYNDKPSYDVLQSVLEYSASKYGDDEFPDYSFIIMSASVKAGTRLYDTLLEKYPPREDMFTKMLKMSVNEKN